MTLSNVLSNTFEDMGDEASSSLINQYAESIFAPLKAQIPQDGSLTNEILLDGLTTLQMGLRNLAIQKVNQYVIEKLIVMGGGYLAYITGDLVVKGVSKLSNSKKFRVKQINSASKIFSSIFGTRDNRIEMAKLAHNMTDTYRRDLQAERANMSRDKSNLINLGSSSSKDDKDRRMNIYLHKTKTGTWTESDRKLYESIVGKIPTGVSWTKLYKQLNEFSEYALTAEGKINNFAETLLDTLTAMHIEKPR